MPITRAQRLRRKRAPVTSTGVVSHKSRVAFLSNSRSGTWSAFGRVGDASSDGRDQRLVSPSESIRLSRDGSVEVSDELVRHFDIFAVRVFASKNNRDIRIDW